MRKFTILLSLTLMMTGLMAQNGGVHLLQKAKNNLISELDLQEMESQYMFLWILLFIKTSL